MYKLLAIAIYFLTCGPGNHTYTQYGHTAIQVVDSSLNLDVCFNYGFFSFYSRNFYTNFIRGRTYYELLVEETADFYADCAFEKRGEVMRQELNLSEDKKRELARALFINALPENKRYLYNFVYDNCATRPYRLINRILNNSIRSTYKGQEGKTYRQFLQKYNRKGSWLDLGINLIFGYKADKKMKGEDRLFLPEELMFFLDAAQYDAGIPLVSRSDIHSFTIEPVPFYQTWYFGLFTYIVFLLTITLSDKRRGKLSFFIDIAVAALFILFFLLVIYLTFFSLHPLVGFSWRLLIFPTIHVCIRSYYYAKLDWFA